MDSQRPYATYSVSLLFATEDAARLGQAVASVANATGNRALLNGDAVPHLTLGMFHVAPDATERLLESFRAFASGAGERFAVPLGAADTFLRKVLFAPVPQDTDGYRRLMQLNAALHEQFAPQFDPGANGNYLPGRWVPHVALAVKLSAAEYERAWQAVRGTDIPRQAAVVALSLARCKPYQSVARHELLPGPAVSALRHNNMSAIRSTGNQLETGLRSQLFKFGFRFRKNDRRLPGSPDIVFPHFHAVVFVNGCFWHAHGWQPERCVISVPMLDEPLQYSARCPAFRFPRTNAAFWQAKFTRNCERDQRDISALLNQGWRVAIVWECSITGKKRRQKIYDTAARISLWLEEGHAEPFREF